MTENAVLDKARLRKTELETAGGLTRLSPLQHHLKDPLSLRKAITAFCYECMGGEGTPGARKMVRYCTAPKCPLYTVRPWQRESQDDELQEEGLEG